MIKIKGRIKVVILSETIVLKPGLAWWVDPGSGRLGARTGSGWRKNRGRKNQVWPNWLEGLTRQDSIKTQFQSVDFFFILLKRCRFDLKKKELTRGPSQNPEHRPWIGPTTGPGLKTISETLDGQCYIVI